MYGNYFFNKTRENKKNDWIQRLKYCLENTAYSPLSWFSFLHIGYILK